MSRKDYDIYETRGYVYRRDGWVCQQEECLEIEIELAHKISQSKANIKMVMRLLDVDKKTALKIIHHPLNLVTSCSKHNSSFNIGNNPVEAEKLLYEISIAISTIVNTGKL